MVYINSVFDSRQVAGWEQMLKKKMEWLGDGKYHKVVNHK